MKSNKKINQWRFWIYVILFISAAVLSNHFVPRNKGFNKEFVLNQPWQYNVLVAQNDFPIFKSEEAIAKERKEALKNLIPYFTYEKSIFEQQWQRLNTKDWQGVEVSDSLEIKNAFKTVLLQVYQKGIISHKDIEYIQKLDISNLFVVNGKMSKQTALRSVFSERKAYEYVMDNIDPLYVNVLKVNDISKYIQPNLELDETKTNAQKEGIENQIVKTEGIVKAGQKIIDKGEIVNYDTYRILMSLKRLTNEQTANNNNQKWLEYTGGMVLMLIFYALLFVFLLVYRHRVFDSTRQVLALISMLILILAMVYGVVRYTTLSVYLVPVTLLPIVLCTFFDSRTAFYTYILMIMVSSFMVPNPFLYILIQIVVGFVTVLSLKEVNQRSTLANTALIIFLTYTIVYLAFLLVRDGSLIDFQWAILICFLINSVTLLFAYGLIYIVEKLFGFVSSLTLVELGNINSDLLMEFSQKAPGSFQHVLQVSNLAVEVANQVGANPLLTRVGALYHDIGKMFNPMLFTENQVGDSQSALNDLPFDEAAQVIIKHTTFGVDLAEKHKLPPQIISFIETHHAQSKTKYFYNSFCNKYPDQEVDVSKFTYPGPKPATKEEAIVMMADSIEAVSRSMSNYDDDTINQMVERIIGDQIAEGSMNEAPLTFKQIEVAKSVFKEKIKNIYHSRVSYPELKEKKRSVFRN